MVIVSKGVQSLGHCEGDLKMEAELPLFQTAVWV